ncbi:hypothetical protein LJB88_00790 [Erysipelotrichaceae bacterium OttesenSCG-928-M19]|nr:hypothetical protein [Erysipelotrichaceae bacterium OttesenSCG-928-M19]
MKTRKILILLLLILLLSTGNINALNKYDKKIYPKINFKKYKNSSFKKYPKKKGTILVTPDKYKRILPIGHAAIVIDKNYVYEATSKGIIRGMNNWHYTKKRVFGLRVKKLSDKAHNKTVDSLRKHLGKKYNFNFLNTKRRDRFYCSHLIFSAFYDRYKINLDTKLFGLAGKKNGAIHPLELVLSKNTKIVYHYAKK